MDTLKPDIVVLTEHGQKEETLKNTRLIGYTLKTGFSRKSHLKGGVAIFVKTLISEKAEEINTKEHSIEMICEIAALRIAFGKTYLYILGVYRTHGNLETGLDVIYDSLETVSAEKHSTVLIGDINIDCLNKGNEFFHMDNTLNCYGMRRIDLPPTRITHTSQSSIDAICTNIPTQEINVEVVNTAISDHTGQLCTLFGEVKTTNASSTVKRRLMSNRNLRELKARLANENWEDVYNSFNVDEAYNKFSCTLQRALDQACPLVQLKQRKKKGKTILNDPNTFQLKQQFLAAQNAYHASGREEHKRYASQLKKEYDLQLRELRKQTNARTILEADNKSKAIWNVINTERKKAEEANLITRIKINGEETTNPKDIADHLNQYFTSIAEETIKSGGITRKPKTQPICNRNVPDFILTDTNRDEMINTIRSLKTKTSAGYDDISSKLLKLCENELSNPLVDIVNKSFTTGVFPSALKMAKVYPKFKKGPITEAANYRPISLIPTFSKIIEKIVLSRLFDHLNTFQLLTPNQHGFLTGKSTTTALINLVEFLLDQTEEGNTATAILLDYSKAFDCLDHEHLLTKLTTLGVQGSSKSWFTSYLTERMQKVEIKYVQNGRINIVNSDVRPITRGVPQGSVLGPVLFILFTNDFPQFIQQYSETLMYADDTVLLLGRTRPEQLDIDSFVALNMAIQYCHNNDLAVNETKTQQLILGRKKQEVSGLPDLGEISSCGYLGVTLDDKLSWRPHVDALCCRLSTGLYVI